MVTAVRGNGSDNEVASALNAGGQSKIRHHVLPQRYLRGFEIPGLPHFVWVFTRDESYRPGRKRGWNPRRIGIRSASVEPGGYAITKPDGLVDHDTFENVFEKIEKRANHVWRMLDERRQLTLCEKQSLAAYIIHLLKRMPRRLNEARPLFKRIVESFPLEKAAVSFAEQGNFAAAMKVYAAADYLKADAGQKFLGSPQ